MIYPQRKKKEQKERTERKNRKKEQKERTERKNRKKEKVIILL